MIKRISSVVVAASLIVTAPGLPFYQALAQNPRVIEVPVNVGSGSGASGAAGAAVTPGGEPQPGGASLGAGALLPAVTLDPMGIGSGGSQADAAAGGLATAASAPVAAESRTRPLALPGAAVRPAPSKEIAAGLDAVRDAPAAVVAPGEAAGRRPEKGPSQSTPPRGPSALRALYRGMSTLEHLKSASRRGGLASEPRQPSALRALYLGENAVGDDTDDVGAAAVARTARYSLGALTASRDVMNMGLLSRQSGTEAVDGARQTGVTPDAEWAEKDRARAKAGLKLSDAALWGLAAAGLLASGALMLGSGLPFAAGFAAPGLVFAGYSLLMRSQASRGGRPSLITDMVADALTEGGRRPHGEKDAALLSEVKALAAAAGVPAPEVIVMPGSFETTAQLRGYAGLRETVLLVHPAIGRHPRMKAVLAHEIQHAKDMGHPVQSLMPAALMGMGLGTVAAAVKGVWLALGLPDFDTELLWAATTAVAGVPAMLAARLAQLFLLELRADLGSVALTGDRASLEAALGSQKRLSTRLKTLRAALGLSGRLSLSFPASVPAAAGAADDSDPSYYRQTPDWAKRIAPDPAAFKTEDDRKRYEAELERLRPLARWMAHFYSRVKEDRIEKPPNILTLQDILYWVDYVKKHEASQGWKLDDSPEAMTDAAGRELKGRDGSPVLVKSIVLEGAKAIFHRTLPSEPAALDAGDPSVTRDLQRELEIRLAEATKVFGKLGVPKHLSALAGREAGAPDGAPLKPSQAEFLDERPSLFEAKALEGGGEMDYIVTDEITKRFEDMVMLYSVNHRDKFWPLLVGETAEGKSSIIRYMFSRKDMRAQLGRAVPVVSLPVSEAMTRRELLGGKSARGIELGFLSLAAMNGFVLVLEELDQASGEFLKALNDALPGIRKHGVLKFEVGGKTVRIPVHKHFWVVATENGSEGNYSMSRNPHSPDFVKRWTLRHYNRFPPAQQAEIMLGLAARWYGEEFVDRHGLNKDFFEMFITQFHEPLRRMASSGRLGGDLQEPYEFNRRNMLRFLQRWLHDLYVYEATGRQIDSRTRNLLMARELMENYGSELRAAGERGALWDHMNIVFELEAKHKVGLVDDPLKGLTGLQIDVRGFYWKDGKLMVDERLVPIDPPLRENGGDRVPGPEHRLTLVPSLAANVYRNLRSRQFGDPQLATGPTGTAKTAGQEFVNHMLREPLFAMTLDEQTPMSDLHGGFTKDPATGEFEFVPGIVARSMMYDPEGVLTSGKLTQSEVRKSPRIGGTLLINEGNASPNLESINPVFDDRILNLADGQHSAVAGGGFHIAVTVNPVGEGYVGYPMSPALKSRMNIVEHPGGMSEEELTEIVLDKLTGIVRFMIPNGDGK